MTTLYLDMDGVVADWDKGCELYLGVKRPKHNQNEDGRWSHEQWLKIRENDRFFRTLPKMHLADELVDLARRFRDDLNYDVRFLTAIPRGNDAPWSFQDKVLWAQDYYPDIPVFFGPYSHDKKHHCKPNDILIDDRLTNIEDWREQNGRAIRVLHDDLAPAINLLQRFYDQERG